MESDPIGLDGGMNTYSYVDSDPLQSIDSDGLSRFKLPSFKKPSNLPARKRATPIKPDKRSGVWSCAVVACCRGDMDDNCPADPKQQCKQAVWRDTNRLIAEKAAEQLAKARLGCQTKHVTVRCTGPKGDNYQRGG